MIVQPHLLSLSAYIDQNLDKDLPLSSLAKRVGLSPFHFHRKFGAYFGESLHQHIKRLRLERAAFQLTYGSKAVCDIAQASGYKTVSAFSHAFSGFAGQSPTRYRSRSPTNGSAADATASSADFSHSANRPAWIGELAPQAFAFVRAAGHGRGAQPSVREAIGTIAGIVEPTPKAEAVASSDIGDGDRAAIEGDRASSASSSRPLEFIAATTDFYGIVNGGNFRIDVGLDADRMPHDREKALGMQMLPGGRYARFDFICMPDELIGRAYRVAIHGLRGLSENARTSSHFVRFTLPESGAEDEPRRYQFFMPLDA